MRRTLKTSGTFTVPDGVYLLELLAVSGGGGGGGGTATGCGGGGGSGWPIRYSLAVVPGDVVTVVVGAGGAGGIGSTQAPAGQGSDGGATIVSLNGVAVLTVPGGGGGGMGGGTQPYNSGRQSFGFGGAAYQGSGPYHGGGGSGYSGGLSGNLRSQVQSLFSGGASGAFERIRGGRRGAMYSPQTAGSTNGMDWYIDLTSQPTLSLAEQIYFIAERFLNVCWGGTLNTLAGSQTGSQNQYATAQPANTGHGGTGAGQLDSTNVNGAAGGSGFVEIAWEAAA